MKLRFTRRATNDLAEIADYAKAKLAKLLEAQKAVRDACYAARKQRGER
jgi:plasmid stabilization system protein ParE